MMTKPVPLYETICRETTWTAAGALAEAIDTMPDPAVQEILATLCLPVLTAGRLVAITLGLDPLTAGNG